MIQLHNPDVTESGVKQSAASWLGYHEYLEVHGWLFRLYLEVNVCLGFYISVLGFQIAKLTLLGGGFYTHA